MQALNVEVYLTSIGFELDKKVDQTAARLCSGLLYQTLTQNRSTHLRKIFAPLKIFEERYAKLFGNNIQKPESKLAYIVASWWQSSTINISNSKKEASQLCNQLLALKSPLEIVAYTDGKGINERIGSFCVIQGKSKAIKKLLGARTCNRVYIRELQDI